MLIKFTSGGRGSGGTIAAYLLDPVRPGREHAAPEVIRGDMGRTRELIDSLSRAWTYTHGVLSFAPEDRPSEAQQQEAMDAFERLAFAGLDPEQWDATWVRHSHTGRGAEHGAGLGADAEAEAGARGGRVELHVVVPRVELSSGRALNIAPPGWEWSFAPLRDALNHTHGWARPDDPARARELHGVPAQAHAHEGLSLREGREGVHAFVVGLVAAGLVRDRAGLVEALEGAGLSVPRQGRAYLTVHDPQGGERIRMKGRLYEEGWSYDAEVDRAAAREAVPADGRDREHGRERAAAAWRELESRVERRARFHAERYGRERGEHHGVAHAGHGEAEATGAVVAGHGGAGRGHDRGAGGLVALALAGPAHDHGEAAERGRGGAGVHDRRQDVLAAASGLGGAAVHAGPQPVGAVRGLADAGAEHGAEPGADVAGAGAGRDDGSRGRAGKRGAGERGRGAGRGRASAVAACGEAAGATGRRGLEDGAADSLRARLARAVRDLGERLRGFAERVRGHGQRARGLVHGQWEADRGAGERAERLEQALGRLDHGLGRADAAHAGLGRCRQQVDGRTSQVEREHAEALACERAEQARLREVEREREALLAQVAERLRDEAPYAASFATPGEARAFRQEMERRFDPGTLARLGRGDRAIVAQVGGNRLDGLCLARAYLDSHGEPERSERRMSLVDAIIDVQVAAQRERQGHEEDGHDWGL